MEPTPLVGEAKTTLTYLPTLMLNVEGAEREMIQLFEELAGEDTLRRAYMLDLLGKIAAEREGQEIATELYGLLREVVFDRQELPQMRLAALTYLRRDLNLDDAMKLKRSLSDEEPPMRMAFSDFLFDLF